MNERQSSAGFAVPVFNPLIHGLRGLAAISVLMFHWKANFPALGKEFPWLLGVFNAGGVHWFFVLSGYQLAGSLWSKPMSRSVLVDFFRKRFIRIYPMVWLHVCLLVIATYLIVGSFSFLNPVQLLGNALLWLHPLPYSVAPYNGVMWTLPVEVMFYVSLPFLFVVYRRGGVWLLILVALSISIGYRGWVWGSSETGSVPDAWLRTYPGLMFSFVVGFALNHFKFQIKDGQRYVFLALGFCLYVWWRYDVQEIKEASAWLKLTWDLWMAFFIALLLFGFRSPLKGFDWLGSRPMVWLGSMSFGIYLWHLPALRWLPRVFPWSWNTKGGSLLALGVCLVFTFAMSIACQALLDRLLPRFRRSAGQGLCKAGQGVSAS